MEKQIFLLVIGFFALSTASPVEPAMKFVDFDVYSISNRLYPEGFLTVSTGPFNITDIPRLILWNDNAGQKWRLESTKLYTAFQIRPTAYESFVLEQEERDTFLKWVASFGHLGHHKMWYLNDAGSGFTQIKNKQFDTCLAGFGMDAFINAVPCTNSEEQQWKFTKLSL